MEKETHDLSWSTCGSHWSPGSGISALLAVTAGGRGGVGTPPAAAVAAASRPAITELRYCCPASDKVDGGGGGAAPLAGVPMRLGSWLLGLGGRIGGVGAWESAGKPDMTESVLAGEL